MPSYVEASLGDFNKAIISLWFRAPSHALQRLVDGQNYNNGGVMPLFTFGDVKSQTYQVSVESAGEGSYDEVHYTTPGGHCDWTPLVTTTHEVSTGAVVVADEKGERLPPSHLGIQRFNGSYWLVLYLLTGSYGKGSGFGQNTTFVNTSYGTGSPSGEILDCALETHFRTGIGFTTENVAPGNPRVSQVISSDDGGITLKSLGFDSFTALSKIPVEPNTWHHLLLSFDVSFSSSSEGGFATSTGGDYGDSLVFTPGTLSTPCKIWAALDNVNYTGDDIREQVTTGSTTAKNWLGLNDFVSRNTQFAAVRPGGQLRNAAWGVSGTWTDALFTSETATFTATGEALPAATFGLPTASNASDKMKHVEMAEFQMWTGATLDTSSSAIRKLFIAPKKNAQGRNTLQPVNPNVAEKALGKPTLRLHGSSRWKKGKNTGTGPDFAPVGKIEKFKPDPEIG